MRKFTLPAGTTNRHKWHKEAAAALSAVTRTFNMKRTIYGQHGGESDESLVSVFGGGPTNPEAIEVYKALGERFDWQITRENADAVRDAFREALPACKATIPVEDNRTTPEQDAERAELLRTQEAERKAAAEDKAERVEVFAAELRKQYPDAEPRSDRKSEQARAAANLKRLLVAQGWRVSVKSRSFSMGNSVTAHVKTPDVPPDVREHWDEIAERFSYSTFDPMTDCSGYKDDDEGTAWRQHFGRTKYCRIEWTRSDENRAAAVEFLGDEAERDNSASHRLWSGAHCLAAEFWAKWAEDHKAPEPEAPAQGGAYRIEKHHHTKRGFDFWLVIPADRVEREEFERLRDSCKAAGGWYSRKWGSTPGGFAFKEQERAGAWAIQEFRDDSGPESDPQGPTPPPKAKQDTQKAEKFREMAEKLAEEVAAKRGDYLENTPKRQREAMSRRIDADHLERTAQALEALADLHEAGEVPALLRKFASKKAVYAALRTRTDSQGYYHVADTGEHSDTSPEAAALWALIDGKSPDQERADRLAEMLAGLPKIPGYYPTPPAVIERMLDAAGIEVGHKVLEPSAGTGAILDAIAEQFGGDPASDAAPMVVAFEINPTLCEVLRAKGYDVRPSDFLEWQGSTRFDRVVMNPPFEKLADIDHVMTAFSLLAPGGRLVAIMSPGAFYRNTALVDEFQDLLDQYPHEVEDIEAGAFKESGTGVASKLVVIDKPEEADEVDEEPRHHRTRDEVADRFTANVAADPVLTEQLSLI